MKHIRPIVFAVACALPRLLTAQTATALKTGERLTGATKQCFYSFAGNEYTKTVQSFELCPLNIQVRTGGSEPSSSTPQPPQRGATAFKTGEEITGNTKQCYYAFAGKRYTKTVASFELCPLSVEVP